MGETGKRYRSKHDSDGKNQKRRGNDRDDKVGDDLIAYRILCPNEVIGSVIGKSGKVINSIRQDTRAKVKVVDPFPGAKDRIITIYCYVKEKEEVEVDDEFKDREPLCPAQDALLKVHAAIAGALESVRDSDKRNRDGEECQILVPSSQSSNIIGKAGATIKRLRNRTRANIKVIPKDAADPTHACAMEFDNFVLITGDSEAVKRALFALSAIMYKFTPREEIPLDTFVPEAPPSIIIPSDLPIYPAGGFYSSADSIVPPRSLPQVIGTTRLHEISGYADTGSTWPVYTSALPVVSRYGSASQSEELTIRVLCPFDKIGRVIGKGGSAIKIVRQASGARIEVDDTKSNRDECVITVISSEASDDLKSMAVEAVLLLQEKINDEDDDTISFGLLISSKVIGCIIGKSGSIINEIRKRTKADVRISKGKKPKSANSNDELVEVVGEVSNVRDALIQIVLRLRDDVLKNRDGSRNQSSGADSLYSSGSGLSVPSALPSMPQITPLAYDQRAENGSVLGLLSSSSLYGYGSLPMGETGYGSMSSYPSSLYGGIPAPSALEMLIPSNSSGKGMGRGGANIDTSNIWKDGERETGYMSPYTSKHYGGLPAQSTLEMLIPSNAVGKVLGKGGVNLENLRKISGAVIEISESKSSRGDRMAIISGTTEEKRSAENLIQAFIMST